MSKKRLKVASQRMPSAGRSSLRLILREEVRDAVCCHFGEAEGRYLRVVLLSDEGTVHNAFFDRGFVA